MFENKKDAGAQFELLRAEQRALLANWNASPRVIEYFETLIKRRLADIYSGSHTAQAV